MFDSPENRFATIRRHACPYLVPLFGETCGPPTRFSDVHGDTQVRVRICILDDNIVRESDCLDAKFVVEADIGFLRNNDYEGACSKAQRRVS